MKPPTERQLTEIRHTLRDTTERILANWAALARQTRDMQRGYPTQTLAGATSNTIAKPVEHLALNALSDHPNPDPAATAAAALQRIEAFIDEARRLDATIRNLVPGGPRCETCGTAADLKQHRWCDTCYRRHRRHT